MYKSLEHERASERESNMESDNRDEPYTVGYML